MQISQSSYSPGSLPNKSAGRNLPSSRSVWGKRNTTTCPAFFMQKLSVYLKCYINQIRFPYYALPTTMTTKPNPAFLAVQPSLAGIGQNQTILPEMHAEVFVHTGGFS